MMDNNDRKLLNVIQKDFPLVNRPFEALGEDLVEPGEAVIGRIQRLKEEGIVRQISAIFDTRSLGYKSSLVAMKIDPARIDEAAEVINQHPGVSHNYRRSGHYNLWFTVAVPPASDLRATVDRLGELAGAEVTRLMPTLKLYKIGVQLDMTGESSPSDRDEPVFNDKKAAPVEERGRLTELEIQAVRELQRDLALIDEPFRPYAECLGLPTAELFEMAEQFRRRGQMRRFAAVLHHRQAGFRANAMGVWVVPEENIDAIGEKMASFRAVSHCYRRPTYPDWPYTVFTMIHGKSARDCQAVIDAISEATGIEEYSLLYSTTEYKKTRVEYFSEESDQWEAMAFGTQGARMAGPADVAARDLRRERHP